MIKGSFEGGTDGLKRLYSWWTFQKAMLLYIARCNGDVFLPWDSPWPAILFFSHFSFLPGYLQTCKWKFSESYKSSRFSSNFTLSFRGSPASVFCLPPLEMCHEAYWKCRVYEVEAVCACGWVRSLCCWWNLEQKVAGVAAIFQQFWVSQLGKPPPCVCANVPAAWLMHCILRLLLHLVSVITFFFFSSLSLHLCVSLSLYFSMDVMDKII